MVRKKLKKGDNGRRFVLDKTVPMKIEYPDDDKKKQSNESKESKK